MKSSEFCTTITRSCKERLSTLQGLVGAVVLSLAMALPAVAQTPPGDPLPKATETISPTVTRSRVTERQSQLNPAPKAHGDTTNRGRMSADFLWGITNGNRTYKKVPMGRIPNQTINNSIQPDGWSFPYNIRNEGTIAAPIYRRTTATSRNPSVIFDDETNGPNVVSLTHPVTALGLVGGFFAGASWAVVTAPTPSGGAGYVGTQYTRSPAVARPAGALADPTDPNDPGKFIWYPTVPGGPGEVRHYSIKLHIPIADTTGAETRISDARYIVSYVVQKANGTYLHKQKVCTLSQVTSGDLWLLGDDGKPAVFTFFSEATYNDPTLSTQAFANGLTYGDPRTRARVELDNTTENDIDGTQFVIADQIAFVQSLAGGSTRGTPTLTPPHGGRKVDTTQAKPTPPDANPYDQPAKGANTYALNIWNPSGTGLAFLNDSFNFINNPRDPAYATVGDPLFGKFDSSDPSVLFRGPESLISPKNALGATVTAVNAENHQQYKDSLGNPVPFFSHMQVLVNKTDYVMDPETGVPDSEIDGTKTIEVGSISAFDWVTGTQLWRFPDKTYLPALPSGAAWRHPDNTLMTGAALRNPYDNVSKFNLIPGINAVDVNGNGKYDDDEIFLVGQGANPNGGLSGSPTIVPNMEVMGDVQVPVYTALGSGRFDINTVTSAPQYRYYQPDPMSPLTGRLPIYMPLAFIGGNNGVLYALDPFGNNDNQYIERAPTAPGVYRSLGEFRPGTTNLLWTFSPTSVAQVISGPFRETRDKYNLRLKGEIPTTSAFGASSPVVTWAKQDDDDTLNRRAEEPRLFIGNQNGVVYALDPRANAGPDYLTGTGMASLPIRKGEQVNHNAAAYNTPGAALAPATRHRTALKWWFETNGSINSTVAVSDTAFPRNAGAAPITASRRLYTTTAEGRVYSLDWDGPVTKMDHEKNMVWDGTSGVEAFLGTALPVPVTRPNFGTAAALNDNSRFHDSVYAARPSARPDLTEGTIRPVWAFPNRYADIRDGGGGAQDNRRGFDQPDFSLAYPGSRLVTPDTGLAAFDSAPVLMDFAINDTDSGVTGLTGIRRYVVVAANDQDSATRAAAKGRLLLLDQEGDRNDFLSNPMPTRASAKFVPSDPAVNTSRPSGPTAKPTPVVGASIYSQQLDEFVWDTPFGKATPVWTYRSIYETYDSSAIPAPIISRRNRPTPGVATEPTTGMPAPVAGEPARRTLPTVFWGGQGRLFALDIDEETGLFLRWRKVGDPQPSPIPLDGSLPIPPSLTAAAYNDFLNPSEPTTGNPFSPIFNVGNQDTLGLALNHVMARTVTLLGDGSSVDGQIVVTGGPVQNRNNSTAILAATSLGNTKPAPLVAGTDPTVPLIPTLDAPIYKPILTLEPPVVVNPVGPVLYDLRPFGFDLDLTSSLAPAIPYPAAVIMPIVDLTGRFVNQDIGDPLATTRGSWQSLTVAPTLAESQNLAYQYPTLVVTTQGGFLHEISTNIEGQDPSVATDPTVKGAGTVGNQFGPLGWAFTDDLNAFNPHGHVHLFSMLGPGGANSGISVVTNAYFPSMDTGYARRKDRLTKQTLPTPNPTGKYLAYPKDEPRSLTSTFGDGPRPGFLPRSLYPGNAADATTTPPTAQVDPDWHTGQTGFPLDLNGLFYDKRYASASPTNHNADGQLKLPAYDQQGTLSVTPPATTGTPETNGERLNNAILGIQDANDNAAGQNVTWIYATGEDGRFFAYTPVFNPQLGGLPSGLVDGVPNVVTGGTIAQPRVDVFDDQVYTALRNAARAGNPIRPDRDGTDAAWVNAEENLNPFGGPMAMPPYGAGRTVTDANMRSVAAKGSKNIYEWGETLNVVAWDVTVIASQPAPPLGTLSAVPATWSATITLRSLKGGTIKTIPVSLERNTGTGLVATYPYVSSYSSTGTPTPSGNRPAQLGLAFSQIKLDDSLGIIMTPGTPIEVDIQINTPIGLSGAVNFSALNGGTLSEQTSFLKPQIFMANPLAVQGFAVSTNTGVPVQAAKAAGQPVAGGIGPFRTPATNNYLDPFRSRVAGQNPTVAMDPDLTGYEYSQALANGNTIQRYDYDQYLPAGMGTVTLNRAFGKRLQANGGTDATYSIPVAASTGYVGHGRTGSTDLSATQRNLRIVNRAPINLSNVRVEVMDDLVWRWWPGRIPNADTDPTSNPAITPLGMRGDGRINPLPWEQDVAQAQPWRRRTTGNIVSLGNISPDYPDIIAASTAQQGRQAVSVLVSGADAVQGPVSLPSGQLTNVANGQAATLPFLPGNYSTFGATVSVRVPLYQPANLVATHSMTSTYEAPSREDGAQPFITNGNTQLPRGLSSRDLRQYNPGSGLFDGNYAITPFGYTSRLRVFVDFGSGNVNNNYNGRWEDGEPFRIVEVWTGVPVDMGLKSTESPVDLGALPAGFGIQNGLMGYQSGASNNPGFLPDPIGRLNPADPNDRAPFDKFFKKMTIQNVGNVNLYNLRAAQKTETLTDVDVQDVKFFGYFGLVSETVDSRYGIQAVGADPSLTANVPYTPATLMPQVVTSLDRQFDAAFNNYLQAQSTLPTSWLSQVTDTGQTVYQRYYAGLAGRHTLHKPSVGSATPSVLSLPDVPSNTVLVPDLPTVPQPDATLPGLGVAVPIGTPVGVYRSVTTASATAPPSLAVYEDHDTILPTGHPLKASNLVGYAGAPMLIGNASVSGGAAQVAPAGPLYNGQNVQPPGLAPIQPVNAGVSAEGTLRARNFGINGSGVMTAVEFQPHTNPAVDVKVTVTETPLTGQIADYALFGYDGIFSGLLNGIDSKPLVDNPDRPLSVVTPAAYRGANGRLNVYFSRNSRALGSDPTAVGAPFGLFHSHMNWDPTTGSFQAVAPGSPILAPQANDAQMFTLPTVLPTASADDSNIYPSVLQIDPLATQATLFWVNSQLNAGALPTDTIFFSRLDANGNPTGTPTSLLSTVLANYQPDPTIRRYGPRAAFDSATRTGFVTFYGGAPGKLGLYYIPYVGDPNGVPSVVTGRRGSGEIALPVPPGIVTATEPNPVIRRLVIPDYSQGSYAGSVFTPAISPTTPVVDVVYTGVLRNTQTPDLFMGRYRTVGAGPLARLTLTALPQIGVPHASGERLVQVGRDLVWRSKHIAWYVRYNPQNTTNPVENLWVRVRQSNGTVRYETLDNAWDYDANSRRWAQVIRRGNSVLFVYVDPDTGEVRFRGADEPQSTDMVEVSYQPTTYRLTPDAASDSGVFVATDNRMTPAVPNAQVYRWMQAGAPLAPAATRPGLGRQWFTWSKGAEPNRPARLYYAARRIGVDLRSVSIPAAGRLNTRESIALTARNAQGNQIPQVSSVVIPGIGPVPYEVDFVTGRIYVDSLYEGLDAQIEYVAAQGATTTTRQVLARLDWVEELAPSDNYSMGVQAPMQQTINEAQVYSFVDLYSYDPTQLDLLRPMPSTRVPDYHGDPTLQPGKLWMFWTSSRPKAGLVPFGGGLVRVPSGFQLFYQTIAPKFEIPSFSTFGQ